MGHPVPKLITDEITCTDIVQTGALTLYEHVRAEEHKSAKSGLSKRKK